MENNERRAAAEKVVETRIGLFIHLLVYVLVNAGLIVINLILTPENYWFIWPLLGWGLGVLLHIALVLAFPRGTRLKERLIEKEMQKQER